MNRFLKAGSIIAVTAVCIGLLTGCGEKSAEWKIGKEPNIDIHKYLRP